jgi:hypothetical protein
MANKEMRCQIVAEVPFDSGLSFSVGASVHAELDSPILNGHIPIAPVAIESITHLSQVECGRLRGGDYVQPAAGRSPCHAKTVDTPPDL